MEHGLMEVNLAQAMLKIWILHYLKTTQWADCVTWLTVVCCIWTTDYAVLSITNLRLWFTAHELICRCVPHLQWIQPLCG